MRKYINIIFILIAVIICIIIIGAFIKPYRTNESELHKADSFVEEIYVEKNAVNEYSSEYKMDIGEFSAITMEKVLCKEENACFSPVSMYTALTLLAESSKGDSQKEILYALGTDNIVDLENNCIQVNESVEKGNGIIETSKTILSNSIWLRNMALDDEAEDVFENCENRLSTYVYNGDFKNADVNRWIEENTNGTIKEVIDNKHYDYIIANVLYHKSKWTNAFTVCGYDEFELNSGKKVMTQYMDWSDTSGLYVKGDNYMAIPVATQGASMIFVCPDDGVSLSSLICENTLNEIIASAEYGRSLGFADIELRVPLFSCEYNLDGEKTKDILNNIGIKTIYENPEWIMVNDAFKGEIVNIVQKTRVTVDEKGIEASGGAVGMVSLGKQDKIIKLMLDKPFMWIIEKDGLPLLVGTVYNPTEG